jgi:hypothetical protein
MPPPCPSPMVQVVNPHLRLEQAVLELGVSGRDFELFYLYTPSSVVTGESSTVGLNVARWYRVFYLLVLNGGH